MPRRDIDSESALPELWRSAARLFPYLYRVRLLYGVSLLLLLVVSGLTALKAWIIRPAVDSFLSGAATRRDLFDFSLVVGGIFVLQGSLNFLYAVTARSAGARAVVAMRRDLFSHLLRQGLGYFAARPSSDLVSRIVNDVGRVELAAVQSLQGLVGNSITVVVLFGVLVVLNWPLAIACLALLALLGLLLVQINRRVRDLSRGTQETLSSLTNQLTELVGGMELVISFCLGERWRRRFDQVNAEYYRASMGLEKASAAAVGLTQVVVGAGIAGIFFLVGGALLAGEISGGQFLSFLAVLFLLQGPVTDVAEHAVHLNRALAAGSRALEILADQPSVTEPADSLPLPPGPLSVEFQDVDFAYGEARVLKGLNFVLQPGQLVAFVGDSGAGKSTVARLLMRFYDPRAGSVRLGGVDIRNVRRTNLYEALGYVSQDVFLFDGTIRDNLLVGNPKATAARIAQVSRAVCLDEVTDSVPKGLDARVGERGVRLSGGEKQRIAIARAILSDPRVVVLDEATSALDLDLERRILQNLADLPGTRTVLAITHRISMANVADRLLILRDGMLVEEGDAQALARQGTEFDSLQRVGRTDGHR